ncbi:MAG: hypothetical protein ACJA2E_001822 [Arenicella sp.]|jgi:hypothetical protein
MRCLPAASILVLIAGLSLAIDCLAKDTFSYPGGIAQLTIVKDSADIPEVQFGLNEPVIMEYSDHWRILIGLSLETLPGEYVAYVKPGVEGSTGEYKKIVVKQYDYPFREYSRLDGVIDRQAIFRTDDSFSDIDFSNTQQPSLPLRWPLKGLWSNNFGHKLYDTKQAVLHTPNAIVISATNLSTVVSPQTAIVSKIRTSDLGISSVYLDHGRGLYSILSGLSDITVEVGNGLVAGAMIGKLLGVDENAADDSASAGRILVWQTVINNAYVDPQVLTQLEP